MHDTTGNFERIRCCAILPVSIFALEASLLGQICVTTYIVYMFFSLASQVLRSFDAPCMLSLLQDLLASAQSYKKGLAITHVLP